jgi:hypothetical protein
MIGGKTVVVGVTIGILGDPGSVVITDVYPDINLFIGLNLVG